MWLVSVTQDCIGKVIIQVMFDHEVGDNIRGLTLQDWSGGMCIVKLVQSTTDKHTTSRVTEMLAAKIIKHIDNTI